MKIFGITKNGGSYVRIDFDRKYYEGETVEFSFGIHQHHLYQTIDGMRVYRFTPGWFDEIVVDELNIYWKSDNIKYVLNGYWEQDDYYQFRTSLAEGEKYTVKIEYDADVFQTEDDKKITHPVGTGTKIVMAVMLLVVPGILLLLIIRAYKKRQTGGFLQSGERIWQCVYRYQNEQPLHRRQR